MKTNRLEHNEHQVFCYLDLEHLCDVQDMVTLLLVTTAFKLRGVFLSCPALVLSHRPRDHGTAKLLNLLICGGAIHFQLCCDRGISIPLGAAVRHPRLQGLALSTDVDTM